MKKTILLLAMVLPPAPAAQAPDTSVLARGVAVYEYGQDRAPLDAMSAAVRASYDDPALRLRLESALLGLLTGQSTDAAKDYACRQLSLIGGDASAPVLSRLVGDARLGAIALYALERIPGKASESALLKALQASGGATRVALINALSSRGIPSPLYARWLTGTDAETASAAAAALGSTGSEADIRTLLAARSVNASARDAALRLAERLGPKGRPVYEALWGSGEPVMARLAALEGLARLDGSKALPAILEALRSPEQAIQAEAIALAARHGGQPQLLAALPTQPPVVQVKILTALSETGAAAAMPAFRDAVSSVDESVRIAAIRAIGRNGGAPEVELLAGRAASAEGVERDEARSALARLRGAPAAAAIVKALPAAEGKVRVELIRAASERGAVDAVPAIVASARSDDRDVRREAYRALRDIAPAESIPELVAMLSSTTTAADRREMERTLAAVLRRHPQAPLAPVEKEYSAAGTSEARVSLLSVMGQSARGDTLPYLRAALAGQDDALRRAAILALTEWPSPDPAPDLLNVARSYTEAALKVLAVRGYIRLVSAPSDRAPADVARELAEVLKVAPQPDEKKALLAALTRFVCRESLDIAKSLTDDAAVAAEAKAAAERLERGLTYRR
jgi:HEAT repeat protein